MRFSLYCQYAVLNKNHPENVKPDREKKCMCLCCQQQQQQEQDKQSQSIKRYYLWWLSIRYKCSKQRMVLLRVIE